MHRIRKIHAALPEVREWIDNLLERYRDQSTPIIKIDFPKLQQVFPKDLLGKAKRVIVNGNVPLPPLNQIGLPEIAQKIESVDMWGITYKDTFFIDYNYRPESLYFHELVHVIQWDRLGVDNFLLAYGVGLDQFDDYKNSPLEQMAYSLQYDFDLGILSSGTVDLIRRKTDAIWCEVAPLLASA